MNDVKPWEQQEGEPDIWYGRFKRYYLPQRGEPEVQEAYYRYYEEKYEERPERPGAAPRWYEVSNEWGWEGRATQYGIAQAEREMEEREEQKRSEIQERIKSRKETSRSYLDLKERRKEAREENIRLASYLKTMYANQLIEQGPSAEANIRVGFSQLVRLEMELLSDDDDYMSDEEIKEVLSTYSEYIGLPGPLESEGEAQGSGSSGGSESAGDRPADDSAEEEKQPATSSNSVQDETS